MYRPEAAGPKPVPLVIVLHGAVGTGAQAEQSYGWDAEAGRGGFVAAFPDGIGRTWNAGPDCCGKAAAENVDDIAFIERLVTAVSAAAPVDSGRVFVTGISNGALLAYRLACASRTFAAIAPVSGTMINSCPAPHPISVLHIHGTADQTIPYGGGTGQMICGPSSGQPVGPVGLAGWLGPVDSAG